MRQLPNWRFMERKDILLCKMIMKKHIHFKVNQLNEKVNLESNPALEY